MSELQWNLRLHPIGGVLNEVFQKRFACMYETTKRKWNHCLWLDWAAELMCDECVVLAWFYV